MSTNRPLVTVLAICAASDLAAVPLVAGDDVAGPVLGVAVGLLGVLTVWAATSFVGPRRPARGLAGATRVIDLVLSLPGLAAGGAVAAAAGTTVALSALAIALLIRSRATAAAIG